jgi:hypothetical protein
MEIVEDENKVVGGAPVGAGAGAGAGAAQTEPTMRLVDVEVTSEIVALNLLVSFLNLAQRRGVFTIDEAAKIWECVKKFQK